jgi:preprotein translocase subunit SecF
VVIPGLVSIVLFGLNLSIDFTGGSRITLSFPENVTNKERGLVQKKFEEEKVKIYTLEASNKEFLIRTNPISAETNKKIINSLQKDAPSVKEPSFETIGPTIGSEITINAVKAVAMSSLLIVIYISYVFRKVPKPASSIRFGVSVVIALLHDVLVVLGVFSILGHFFSVEIDSLFVTALLTVIGFSVHDTIVVFDRIRENLDRAPGTNFATVVNDSILQTLNRSLNTSLTVVLVLFALLLFGGETIRWFVVALLIGVISGTYSSIFNAAPILVVWHEWSQRRNQK